MLRGKPAGESDTFTSKAINGLLEEHEEAFTSIRRDAVLMGPAQKPAPVPPLEVTLQPVKIVEERIVKARYTTVPDSDETELNAAIAPGSERKSNQFAVLAPQSPESPSVTTFAQIARYGKTAFLWTRDYLTWNRVCFFALVALAVMRPGLVIFTIILALFAVVGAFLFIGADRIWSAVSDLLKRVERFSPRYGDKMRVWLDSVAYRWDWVLDRFPEGSVDQLYMPDFSAMEEDARRHDAVVADRLDRMHEQV